MNLSNLDNYSKTSAFKNFKRLSYEYYPRFSKICNNKVHLNQFLVYLYGRMTNFLNIDKLFKVLISHN